MAGKPNRYPMDCYGCGCRLLSAHGAAAHFRESEKCDDARNEYLRKQKIELTTKRYWRLKAEKQENKNGEVVMDAIPTTGKIPDAPVGIVRAPQLTLKYCTKCGAGLYEDWLWCGYCGDRLTIPPEGKATT